MQKLKIFILSLVTILLLTGCGSNKEETLVCTTKESDDGMDTVEVMSMTYLNNELTRMKMEVDIKVIYRI